MKVILITGGSRGIGAAVARAAADKEYAVVVNYHSRADAAEALVSEIEEGGGEAASFRADVGAEEEVLALFEFIDRKFGRLDALVNNAGILETQCTFDQLTVERFERILRTNVIGSFLCAREAVKRMEGGGSIVNVSSVASRLGAPGEYVDYAASKGALDSMTVGLAREMAGKGIRVNAVRPGLIHTEIHASGGEPGRVDRVGPRLPLGRGGTPEEVAAAVLFLVDDATFTTGSFLELSGGL